MSTVPDFAPLVEKVAPISVATKRDFYFRWVDTVGEVSSSLLAFRRWHQGEASGENDMA
jgi:hypothetical protein